MIGGGWVGKAPRKIILASFVILKSLDGLWQIKGIYITCKQLFFSKLASFSYTCLLDNDCSFIKSLYIMELFIIARNNVCVCVCGVRGLQSPAFGSSSINKSLREELPSTCLPFVLMEWGNRKEKHKNTAAIWPFFLKYWKVVCCCGWSSVNFGCGTRRRRTGWLFPCNFLSYFIIFRFLFIPPAPPPPSLLSLFTPSVFPHIALCLWVALSLSSPGINT